MRLVRISHPGGPVVYSAGFCVPVFNSRVILGRRPLSLFAAWFPGFQAMVKSHGIPIVASESRLADLSQLKPTIFHSDAYTLGDDLGPFTQFRTHDPRSEEYLRAIAPGPAAFHYGNSFLTDALFIDSGNLRRLAPMPKYGDKLEGNA